MRFLLFLLLVLCTYCVAQTEQEQKEALLERRKLAEKRMKAREEVYNFADASAEFKRYHPTTFNATQVSELHLLKRTEVPRGTSPRRRMDTVKYLPTEIADTARSMALWSHICDSVGMCEDNDVNKVASEILERGDAKWIDPLMWFGADPNAVGPVRSEPMLWVAKDAHNVEAVKTLIAYGADLDWKNSDGWTAAADCHDFEVLQAFLEAGVDPKDPHMLTNVIFKEMVPGLRLLLSLGADPNATLWSGEPIIYLAYEQNDTELMRVLLEHHVDPDVRFHADTLSYRAINDDRMDVLRLLLDFHANPSIESDDGTPLLYGPVSGNKVDVVKLLVERGANVRWQSAGYPFIWVSVLNGHREMTELLLSYGMDPNWQNPVTRVSLLDDAALHGHSAVMEVLLERGANPNILSSNNVPIVINEVTHGRTLASLLRYGADVNAKDEDGVPLIALHMLHNHRNPGILRSILAHRPDLGWQNAFGDSLAIIAAAKNDGRSLSMLVQAGIDLSVRNHAGRTALVTAIYHGAHSAIRVLINAGRLANEDAFTVLKATVGSRNVGLLEELCQAGLYDRLTQAQEQELYAVSAARTS